MQKVNRQRLVDIERRETKLGRSEFGLLFTRRTVRGAGRVGVWDDVVVSEKSLPRLSTWFSRSEMSEMMGIPASPSDKDCPTVQLPVEPPGCCQDGQAPR